MQLTCPDCQLECTVDEQSAETVTCPGCGILLYSKSGYLRSHSAHLVVASGKQIEIADEHLEKTREWQKNIDDILPEPDEFPQQLGRYELKKKLGQGSFAEVYLAFDSELNREVALKTPRRSRFSSAEQLSKFLEEARVSAILEHPGVVRVYDIGRISDEICFISMEYCPGGSLSDRLKSELPSYDHAAELVESLAEGIHFAHLNGFVHRDLKPSNIMFGRDGRPRIVDFGLAISDEGQLKRVGEIAGTLPYMSPEQVQGNVHHLDGRTDIWSLGVILYQLLAGRRPFIGSRELVVDQIQNRDAKPLRQIKDDVPAELEAICLRCLQKSPSARYSTAKDLAQVLRAFRDRKTREHIELDRKPNLDRDTGVYRWLRPVQWTLILVVGLFVGILAVYAIVNAKREPTRSAPVVGGLASRPAESLNVLPFELGSRQHGTARQIWYHLMERKPQPYFICERRWDPAVTWNFDPLDHSVNLISTQRSLVAVGDARTSSYILDVSFRLPGFADNSEAGVFWGGKPEKSEAFRQGNSLYVLMVYACRDGKKQPVCDVILKRMTLWQSLDGIPSGSSDAIAAVRLPRPDRPEFRVTINLNSAGIRELQFNGLPYDTFKACTMRYPPESKLFRSVGALGVYNSLGSLVCDRFDFQPLGEAP